MKHLHQPLYNMRQVIILISLLGILVSCQDTLTEKPYKYYNADIYFTSVSRLEMAMLSVYESLNEQDTYGQYWMVYDTDTDVSMIEGASATGHVSRDLGHYKDVYSSHTWLRESWARYYSGIDRANLVIARAPEVPANSEEDKKLVSRYVAEAKTLRGLYYFDLIRLYGDVPLKLKYSEANDNFNMVRTDKELVYDQIITDINEAIISLPWHDEIGGNNVRMNKGAALALLARVYMFRAGYSLRQDGIMKRPDNYIEYYKEAEKCISQIDVNRHELNSSYEKVFKNYCQYIIEPKESMFEIAFFNPSGAKKHSGTYGSYNGPKISDKSSYGRANSFIKTSNVFYSKYEQGDLRRDVAIAKFEIKDATNAESPIAVRSNQLWSPGKWRRNWQTGTVKDNNNTDVNFCLIRYADVLLMDAEAKNEINNGPTAEAIEAVNQVRRRAFGHPVKVANAAVDLKTSDFDHGSFLKYIQLERARELCFENGRRMDLIRWNKLEETIRTHNQEFEEDKIITKCPYILQANLYFTSGKHELYPIPDRERRETGYALTQNPKYE